MKKNFLNLRNVVAIATCLAAMTMFTACGDDKGKKDNNGDNATGVTIGNVTWAACNVDDFQKFAAKPDMFTKFYQWNRETAWAATGSVSGWNSTADNSETWTINPCPAGWRLPTRAEFRALDSVGSTWAEVNARGNAVAGRFYGANYLTATMSNMAGCIFLPACGNRRTNGEHINYDNSSGVQGSSGYYWSSTQAPNSTTSSYNLFFYSFTSNATHTADKVMGFNVRCVQVVQ